MRRRLVVLLLILVIASSALVGYFILGIPRHLESEVPARYPVANHSPITIASDEDFTKPGTGSGCECVRSGSGQERDPYLISDWIVDSTNVDGITIWMTDAYFMITRLVIHGNSTNRGIYISQAQNGIVENSQIRNWWFGIYVFRSSNLEFINNTVSGNEYGIQLEASSNNRVIANRFDENGQVGIFVRGSNNIVKDNSATRNGFGGINVDGTGGSANENQLEGNTASENPVYGIGVWRGHGNVLRSNTATHNDEVGIMLTDHSTKNLVEANTVLDNAGSGIVLIDGSSENTIRENTAKRNGDGVNDFDLYDSGSGNIWQNNAYDTKKPDSIN